MTDKLSDEDIYELELYDAYIHRIPLEPENPIKLAEDIIDELLWLFIGLYEESEYINAKIEFHKIISTMKTKNLFGEEFAENFCSFPLGYVEKLKESKNLSEDQQGKLFGILGVAVFSVQVINEYGKGNSAFSYTILARAERKLGLLVGQEGGSGAIYSPASEMAKLRHKENYEIRNEVIKYYSDNIDKTLSAQKAANIITAANIVPLSHKKIAEIVSALRKKEALRKE